MSPTVADDAVSRMFSLPNLIGGFLFSGIGFVAFVYGKKMERWKPRLIGLVLMIYPFFAGSLWWLYGAGIALTVALYIFREE
jgi:hypothetical protein